MCPLSLSLLPVNTKNSLASSSYFFKIYVCFALFLSFCFTELSNPLLLGHTLQVLDHLSDRALHSQHPTSTSLSRRKDSKTGLHCSHGFSRVNHRETLRRLKFSLLTFMRILLVRSSDWSGCLWVDTEAFLTLTVPSNSVQLTVALQGWLLVHPCLLRAASQSNHWSFPSDWNSLVNFLSQ